MVVLLPFPVDVHTQISAVTEPHPMVDMNEDTMFLLRDSYLFGTLTFGVLITVASEGLVIV